MEQFHSISQTNHKTYFVDIDGTIVKYRTNEDLDRLLLTHEDEELLPGVHKFWNTFEEHDRVIITTARKSKYRSFTEDIFKKNGLRYDVLLMDLENGPRILINDTPSMLLKKAVAINLKRDEGFYFYSSDEEMSNSED